MLFWLEKFVAYMNRAAYIHMAMYNSSFKDSVHSVGNLLSRNSFRSIVLGWISFFVLFMAKISISAISVLYAARALFQTFDHDDIYVFFKSSHMGTLLVTYTITNT